MMRLPFTSDELSAIAFGKIGRIVHHLDDERLPRRRVERVDDALQRLQDQHVA